MTVLTGKTPVDDLLKAAEPGWPRAMLRVPWKPKAYPLPWVSSWKPAVERDGFKQLDKQRWKIAEGEGICFCCGEPLGRVKVMGRHSASYDRGDDEHTMVWLTDGPAGHPRCIALAAEHCPHLRTQHQGRGGFIIAFTWDRAGLGYIAIPEDMAVSDGADRLLVRPGAAPITLDALRELASVNPLGDSLTAVTGRL